jgi:hypothetical protein
MATPVIGLDLFVLLVDYVFGNVIMALVGWGVLIMLTAIMGRLSLQTDMVILVSYFAVAGVGFFGALAAVPLLIWAVWFAVSGVLNWMQMARV